MRLFAFFNKEPNKTANGQMLELLVFAILAVDIGM